MTLKEINIGYCSLSGLILWGLKREGFVMQIDRSLNVDYTTIKKSLPYD
ncbi:hypothetical protein [Saccharolobus islandicus]|nr:hypothetical protein [Sulfolobus islandicus]